MRCPRCSELAPEGAAICDNCDEILDASFLGTDDDTPVEGEKTDVGPAPTPSRMPDRLKKAPARKGGGWNPSGSAPSAEPQQRRPYLAEPTAPVLSPGDEARKAASDLQSFFKSLSLSDRWTTGATALLLVALALPWRWTKEDEDVIGIVAAWPLLLLGIGVLVLVYLRSRKADAAQDRKLRLAQLAATAGAAIFTGVFLPWATQTKTLRAVGKTIAMPLSYPELGAYLGLICAVAALGATLPVLRSD